MPRKFTDALINDAIKRLSEGKMLKTVAEELGVCPDNLSVYVRKRGFSIPQHRRTEDRTLVPEDAVISMYKSGVSELAIARHFGCSRNVIRRRILRAGIVPRGEKEANKLRYRETTQEYRQALTRAAHEARRGEMPHSQRCHYASSRENTGNASHFGPGEAELASFLEQRGLSFIRQKAIDIYNVDFAIGHVAVEVTCATSRYRGGSASVNERLKKILECGYSPITIEFSSIPVLTAYLEDIVSAINEARSLPPFKGEYWMIRCYSKDSTVYRNEFGQFASVKTPVQLFYERKAIQL